MCAVANDDRVRVSCRCVCLQCGEFERLGFRMGSGPAQVERGTLKSEVEEWSATRRGTIMSIGRNVLNMLSELEPVC